MWCVVDPISAVYVVRGRPHFSGKHGEARSKWARARGHMRPQLRFSASAGVTWVLHYGFRDSALNEKRGSPSIASSSSSSSSSSSKQRSLE